MKHAAAAARDSGEFVWNLATWDLREAMNTSSTDVAREESEFDLAGLALAPCERVGAPRVAASPCALECRVLSVTELTDLDGRSADQHLVIGQVVGVHLDEAQVVDGDVDTARLRPLGRCGHLGDYAVVDELFEMRRP